MDEQPACGMSHHLHYVTSFGVGVKTASHAEGPGFERSVGYDPCSQEMTSVTDVASYLQRTG